MKHPVSVFTEESQPSSLFGPMQDLDMTLARMQTLFCIMHHSCIGSLQSLDWTSGLDWTCELDWWTGLVDWTGGLDWWTGLVDWTGGLDWWTGPVD